MSGRDDDETTAAFADAKRRGVGWVQIRRITIEQFRLSRVDPGLVVVMDDPTAYLDRLRAIALAIPCASCGAPPRERCVTSSGNQMSTFHVARSGPVYEAWRLGHRDGIVDAFRRIFNDQDTPAVELLSKHGAPW